MSDLIFRQIPLRKLQSFLVNSMIAIVGKITWNISLLFITILKGNRLNELIRIWTTIVSIASQFY